MMNSVDSYNVEPSACRWCNQTRKSHGWGYGCTDRTGRWSPPPDWLILARMRIRKTDPMRWISGRDHDRRYCRKWST